MLCFEHLQNTPQNRLPSSYLHVGLPEYEETYHKFSLCNVPIVVIALFITTTNFHIFDTESHFAYYAPDVTRLYEDVA